MSAPEKNYKDTILLPETGFPMRGDLTKNEPVRLTKWEDTGLYERILSRRMAQGAPRFLLHDGPPFANGDVHMGTALNKILKDLVLKSKTMAGYAAPYIPGWDCHGLPIEFKVVQKARDLDAAEIRRRCAEFAKGFIDIQRTSFRRLGVFGDWENPYLTMKPAYEANILRVFAKLVEDGAVYQSRKPVQWSYGAYTALAEAEIDYKEKGQHLRFRALPASGQSPGAESLHGHLDHYSVDAARQRRTRPPSAFHLRGRQVHEERPDGKPHHRQGVAGCLRSENGLGSCGNHP